MSFEEFVDDKRSLNFFQAVFTHVVVESSQPPAADSMFPK